VLQTGSNANPALDRKPVPAFSDFLLHDVGTGDGMQQAAAAANEIRTAPLWGLRFRRPLLHDGRSLYPVDAIQQHGNEAQGAKSRFNRLSSSDEQALLAFLNSL